MLSWSAKVLALCLGVSQSGSNELVAECLKGLQSLTGCSKTTEHEFGAEESNCYLTGTLPAAIVRIQLFKAVPKGCRIDVRKSLKT